METAVSLLCRLEIRLNPEEDIADNETDVIKDWLK
jgi:hypothetical protein